MRIRYINKKFQPASLALIDQANAICGEYAGFSLTLRQLYYQFVARGLIPNEQRSYDRLGAVISVTGRTLQLGVVTEDTRRFGHNDRINLSTHLAHVRKVAAHSPERVLS